MPTAKTDTTDVKSKLEVEPHREAASLSGSRYWFPFSILTETGWDVVQ